MSLSDVALVNLTQAKSFLRIDADPSTRIEAEYIGVGDDVETVFTLDNTPIEGSLRLYVAGVLQVDPDDFSISGATITFVTAPATGEHITASYDKAATADTFESYDDLLLENIIEAATRIAEDATGRAFVKRQIIENHVGDDSKILRVYRRPVVTITSVNFNGDILEEDVDYVPLYEIGRLKRDSRWTQDYVTVVTYTAGYGNDRAATQALVPDAVLAVLLIISDLYENRGDRVDAINISGIGSTSYKLPSRASELLNPLKTEIC